MWNGARPTLNARPADDEDQPNTSTWWFTLRLAIGLEHLR
jgi:hypothetical protein